LPLLCRNTAAVAAAVPIAALMGMLKHMSNLFSSSRYGARLSVASGCCPDMFSEQQVSKQQGERKAPELGGSSTGQPRLSDPTFRDDLETSFACRTAFKGCTSFGCGTAFKGCTSQGTGGRGPTVTPGQKWPVSRGTRTPYLYASIQALLTPTCIDPYGSYRMHHVVRGIGMEACCIKCRL